MKFNLCLISNDLEGLNETEAIIKKIDENIKIKIIFIDFSKSYQKNFYEELFQQLNELDISILVNNVGINITDKFTKLTIN